MCEQCESMDNGGMQGPGDVLLPELESVMEAVENGQLKVIEQDGEHFISLNTLVDMVLETIEVNKEFSIAGALTAKVLHDALLFLPAILAMKEGVAGLDQGIPAEWLESGEVSAPE